MAAFMPPPRHHRNRSCLEDLIGDLHDALCRAFRDRVASTPPRLNVASTFLHAGQTERSTAHEGHGFRFTLPNPLSLPLTEKAVAAWRLLIDALGIVDATAEDWTKKTRFGSASLNKNWKAAMLPLSFDSSR